MITFEIPLWMLIIVVVCQCLLLIHLCFSDLWAKIFYRKFKEEEEPHKFYISRYGMFDLTQMFGRGNEPTPKEFEQMMLNDYEEE